MTTTIHYFQPMPPTIQICCFSVQRGQTVWSRDNYRAEKMRLVPILEMQKLRVQNLLPTNSLLDGIQSGRLNLTDVKCKNKAFLYFL